MERRRMRRLWRIAGWIAPVLALAAALAVVRGAGVPLSLPGVVAVFAVLVILRLVIARRRRKRARRTGG